MTYLNPTANQHYISQVELRLNALNKNAAQANKRIYKFKLIDREKCIVQHTSNKGVLINRALSMQDLFSFEVLGKKTERYNFENLFNQYENELFKYIQSLMNKINNKGQFNTANVSEEVINIFALKFLNFIRNPYSIKKVINTFLPLIDVHPTDLEIYKDYQKVLTGKKPQQLQLCKTLGISDEEYNAWLRIIFILLSDLAKGKRNLYENLVISLFENKNLYTLISIFTYDKHECLVSDRGYTIPLPDEPFEAWAFNLNANAFIIYTFANLDKVAPKNFPKDILSKVKERKLIQCTYTPNDLVFLKKYHENLVYQCHEHVYSSSKNIYGVDIED